MNVHIQSYTKLPVFNELTNLKKMVFNGDDIHIKGEEFKIQNTYSNFIKFRFFKFFTLFIVFAVVLYSFIQMTAVTGFKSVSFFVVFFAFFYGYLIFRLFLSIKKNKEIKDKFFIPAIGIVYIGLSAIIEHNVLALFNPGYIQNVSLNQQTLYSYFFILLISAVYYYFSETLRIDYFNLKNKKTTYYKSKRNVLLVVNND